MPIEQSSSEFANQSGRNEEWESGAQLGGPGAADEWFDFEISESRTVLIGKSAHRPDEAMLSGIQEDFETAFRQLVGLSPAVTVFGSARPTEDSPYYELARQVGRELAEGGFAVITGGGPGVMEAANRGAKDVGGHSIGMNIVLPKEQRPNPYLDLSIDFDYFFARKVSMTKFSTGFIVAPGGFGTFDELFEILTLRQTAKMPDLPIVLIGKEFWTPLINLLKDHLLKAKFISPSDIENIYVTDSPQEAVDYVKKMAMDKHGLREVPLRLSA